MLYYCVASYGISKRKETNSLWAGTQARILILFLLHTEWYLPGWKQMRYAAKWRAASNLASTHTLFWTSSNFALRVPGGIEWEGIWACLQMEPCQSKGDHAAVQGEPEKAGASWEWGGEWGNRCRHPTWACHPLPSPVAPPKGRAWLELLSNANSFYSLGRTANVCIQGIQ